MYNNLVMIKNGLETPICQAETVRPQQKAMLIRTSSYKLMLITVYFRL